MKKRDNMSKPVFNPSQPFEVSAKPKFDPNQPHEDADWTDKVKNFFTGENYDWTNAPRDLAQGQIDAIPAYTGAFGSAVGLGNPAVTGAFTAAGDSFKNGLNHLIHDDLSWENELRLPTSSEIAQVTNKAVDSFNNGAMSEMGGQLLGKGLSTTYNTGKGVVKYGVDKTKQGFQKAADLISPAKEKLNAPEIIAAAKELGIEVTPGMLDDSGFVERLESSLAKSPSYFGQKLKRALTGVYDGLNKAGQELTDEATNLEPFAIGEKFKSNVTANLAEKLDPISSVFNEVAESTKHIPVGERSLERVGANIANDDLFSLGVGSETAKKYVDAIPKLKNANQIKSLMTALNEDLRAAQGSDRQVLGMIKEKLARLENNSIVRGAIQAARETGSGPGSMKAATGEAIGKDIVGDLLDARKAYAGVAKDVAGVAKEARLKIRGPGSFGDVVEQIPSERIQDKFFNVDNIRQIKGLQDVFPEAAELLRQGKLKEGLEAAIDNSLAGQGQFASNKFLKWARGLNPSAQVHLFGQDGAAKIANMQTVQNAMPRNFNPSGTASELGWKDIIQTNVKDAINYGMYRGAAANMKQPREAVTEYLMKSPQMQEVAKNSPAVFQSLVLQFEKKLQPSPMELPKAAENQSERPGASAKPLDKIQILEKTRGSKYEQVLQNASNKGEQSFNTAHYILSQRDPEYRKQTQDEN
jgi:hypothetical protein